MERYFDRGELEHRRTLVDNGKVVDVDDHGLLSLRENGSASWWY
jgi:hypothetical protein